MLRESTFSIGGLLTIGLGVALAAGLVWAGAGVEYVSAYLAAALGVVLGSFFVYAGGAEARERRYFLIDAERPAPCRPNGPKRPP